MTLKKAPQHLGGPKYGVYGPFRERGRCIVLRSPRFTTFELPEAASRAFQYRTALAYEAGAEALPLWEEVT